MRLTSCFFVRLRSTNPEKQNFRPIILPHPVKSLFGVLACKFIWRRFGVFFGLLYAFSTLSRWSITWAHRKKGVRDPVPKKKLIGYPGVPLLCLDGCPHWVCIVATTYHGIHREKLRTASALKACTYVYAGARKIFLIVPSVTCLNRPVYSQRNVIVNYRQRVHKFSMIRFAFFELCWL